MPAGRPTKYKPEYCEKLIKHMTEGYSFESFAAIADCCVDTLNEWAKVHPEFSAAKKRAFAKSMVYWEKMGKEGSSGDLENFKQSSWIYTMKCRFGRMGWMEPPQQVHQKSENININADDILDRLSPDLQQQILNELNRADDNEE